MDKETLVRHLEMNHNLAKWNFDNLNNPETLKNTNRNNLMLVVLCYCQAFGGIWKIYNKQLTYKKDDLEEIKLLEYCRWCEKFCTENFGFTI